MSHPDPPAAAVANGHDLEWDPSARLVLMRRWVCRRCDADVVAVDGERFGDAMTKTCNTSSKENLNV